MRTPSRDRGEAQHIERGIDKQKCETRLSALGYSWQWQKDQSLRATTPTLPAVRRLPDGSDSFFNQVIAAYRGWKRTGDSPDEILTFGNGASIPVPALEAMVRLADRFTVLVDWQDGDVALVDNHRIMHGRKPYSATRKRQVLVCSGQRSPERFRSSCSLFASFACSS